MHLKHQAFLPVELVSAIIEYSFGEKDELERLALVSKTWTVQSRRLLLRCVRLKVSAERDDVAAFARFLDAPLGSRSRAHIRHVIVEGIPCDDDEYDEPTVGVQALGEMLVKVPRVASVELHIVKFRGVEPEDPDPPLVWHVQWMYMTRSTTWMAHDLKNTMDVFRLFPNLKEYQTYNGRDLLLDTVPLVGLPLVLPPKRRPFPEIKLETLSHKIYGPSGTLLKFLVRELDLSCLTTLIIWHIDIWEVNEALSLVLAHVKKSLKRFELNLTEVRYWLIHRPKLYPRKCWPKIGLQDLEVLEVFCLFVPLDDDPEKPAPAGYRPYWDSAEAICTCLPRSLRRLYLGIEVVKEPEWQEEVLHEVRWVHIARGLGDLPQLERIQIYHEFRWFEDCYFTLPEWIQDILTAELPGLHARGLLKFDMPKRAGPSWRV